MACEVEKDPQRYLDILRSAFGKHYGEGSDVWTADGAMRAFPGTIQARLALPPTARVLDVGCGAGRDVEAFASLYASVDGIDLSAHPDWEGIRRRRANVRFVPVDLLGHAWEHPYDLVFDNGCFHHQHPAHYRAYLERIARMVGAGGAYVLSTFKNPAVTGRLDENGRLHRYFSDGELRAELQAAGLEIFDELDVAQDARRELYRLTFSRPSAAPPAPPPG